MNNLEFAKDSIYNSRNRDLHTDRIPVLDAILACEIAAKTNWFNPLSILPSDTREVLIYFKNDWGFHVTSAVFDINSKLFYDNYETEYKSAYDSKNIIEWCDLPVRN